MATVVTGIPFPSPSTFFFTGSGGRGNPIGGVYHPQWYSKALLEYAIAGADPRSKRFLSEWGNPGHVHGYQWFDTLTRTEGVQQAKTMLDIGIIRTNKTARWLSGSRNIAWKSIFSADVRNASSDIKDEILRAPDMKRADYFKIVARRYGLDPSLLAAIVLTEQRDQSQAGDFIKWLGGYHRGDLGTSMGLGQVRGKTLILWNLLEDVFDPKIFRRDDGTSIPKLIYRCLADEALNINATAKYIRLLVNQAVTIQRSETNLMHELDSGRVPPPQLDSQGRRRYINQGLRDLSVLEQDFPPSPPLVHWTSLHDTRVPSPTPPVTIRGLPTWMTLPTQELWDLRYRGQYYVRVIANSYTSSPFDPYTLEHGFTEIAEDPPGSSLYKFQHWPPFIYIDAEGNQYEPLWIWGGPWLYWASEAFDDVKKSGLI